MLKSVAGARSAPRATKKWSPATCWGPTASSCVCRSSSCRSPTTATWLRARSARLEPFLSWVPSRPLLCTSCHRTVHRLLTRSAALDARMRSPLPEGAQSWVVVCAGYRYVAHWQLPSSIALVARMRSPLIAGVQSRVAVCAGYLLVAHCSVAPCRSEEAEPVVRWGPIDHRS